MNKKLLAIACSWGAFIAFIMYGHICGGVRYVGDTISRHYLL